MVENFDENFGDVRFRFLVGSAKDVDSVMNEPFR